MQTLFLDRDGVINVRKSGDYVQNRSDFIFEKGALEALVLLSKNFQQIIVVTNQAGIAKGRMTSADVLDIHTYMQAEVAKAGGHIDGVYFCPHLANGGCNCRKPRLGMAFQAKADFSNSLIAGSWMVGDSGSDMLFGRRLGMKTALIAGKWEEKAVLETIEVTARFESLLDFALKGVLKGF
jgi:D-glycero-D-manno-heptose 1,7-bisphosphate phosphatase